MSHVDSSLESPRVLGVCAGIGGLELGVKLALPGARLVGLCERDSYAAAVLLERMEDEALDPAPVFAGDLHEFPAADFAGRVDLLCGGIPCQPYSVAGKRRRGDDERDLVDAFLAIARTVGPRFVFVENVAAFAADGLGRLLGGLAALGFDAEWTTLRASDVGAPHRRERCFVLARRVSDAERDAVRQLAERGEGAAPAPERRHSEPGDLGARPLADAAHDHGRSRVGAKEAGARPHGERGRRLAGGSADVADANGRRCGERRIPQHAELEGARRGVAHGRGHDWPLDWPPGPADRGTWARVLEHDPDLAPALGDVRRVADGVPAGLVDRTDRLRCLGNAVVPRQAQLALLTLLAAVEL